MNKRISQDLAERLDVYNEGTIKRAEEFLRIYHSKPCLKSLNDQAVKILCLDLAAKNLGEAFDNTTAVKLSGLKKSVYENNSNNLEKILELDKQLTISDICIQLGCLTIKEDAEEILNKYKQNDNKIIDINHPQYISAAIYLACRAKRISIEQSKLLNISRLKKSQWKELLTNFDKLNLGIKTFKSQTNDVDEQKDNERNDGKIDKKVEEEIENYEVWKKRILDEAYAVLNQKKDSIE